MSIKDFKILEWLLGIGAAATAIIAISKLIKYIWNYIKFKFDKIFSFQKRYEEQMNLLAQIAESVKPNGGSSLWDQVMEHRKETSGQHQILRQEIALSQGLWQANMQTKSEGIWQSDANGSWIFINYSLSSMMGLSSREAEIDGWRSCIHPADQDRVWSEWDASVEQKRTFSARFKIVNIITGQEVAVHATTFIIRDKYTDNVIGFIGHVIKMK